MSRFRSFILTASGVTAVLLWACGGESTTAPPNPPGDLIGDPLPGLSPTELAAVGRGRAQFDRAHTVKGGLGPQFNGTACTTCHQEPTSGGSSTRTIVLATRVMPDGSCDDLAAKGGPVYQTLRSRPLRATIGFGVEPVPAEATDRTLRITPDLFGFGLLDAVPEATILALEDPSDMDGDGISGRASRTLDGRVGRFGRKAEVATLAEFNAAAFLFEIGLTSPAHPEEGTFGAEPLPAGVDPAPDPELSEQLVAQADTFVRFLEPPFRGEISEAVERGEVVFREIGCASCHVPTLRTGDHPVAAIADRDVDAYTDLLLHDMGPGLADVCLGAASRAEFRTEPLMGLRLMSRFLHDGRASTVGQAIESHGGEATLARDRYRTLSMRDRSDLLAFLGSL